MSKHKRYKTPKWSKLNNGKVQPVEPLAGSWPMYYFKRNWRNQLTDSQGRLISLKIKNPQAIDFRGEELETVKNTLANLTEEQRNIAKYYGFGPPTKQWTPVIDRLIDTYNVNPTRAARIIAVTQAAINDAMMICWDLKYKLDVARPEQLDENLGPVLSTPPFPAYPSGHATASGCAEIVLTYFFPAEEKRLREITDQNALSRLYAGVHFPADNDEGLRVGRQIGQLVVEELKRERNSKGGLVDIPFKEFKGAVFPPPPYEQLIPYPPTPPAPTPQPLFRFF